MEHLGDITKISGYTAPAVDVIVGGSPCQDLSIAGKGAGLSGERSGLFMEQIRIIKEMRQRDVRDGRTGVAIRPRYMVWENVPGAFSSNGGEDFRTVLQETARIADEAAAIPRPPKGKWTNAGCIMGDGWSLAWRVLDAQFWGVPQRRRRIALVADFGGASAPEILFIRKSLCGDTAEGGAPGKAAAGDAAPSAGTDDCLSALQVVAIENHSQDSRVKITGDRVQTLSRKAGTGGNDVPLVMTYRQQSIDRFVEDDCLSTMKSRDSKGATDLIVMATQQGGAEIRNDGIAPTLTAAAGMSGNNQPVLCTAAVDYRNFTENADVNGTLQAKDSGGSSLNLNNVVRQRLIVRRLTPLECERLQGYPDGWTDIGEWADTKGKRHKEADSPRYMALGNSIALPVWKWVMKRVSAQYERNATLASLFDGIGGFPYIWEQLNGKGSCLWASEIEEFPMAVTKARIG